jgi:hypothetical protein
MGEPTLPFPGDLMVTIGVVAEASIADPVRKAIRLALVGYIGNLVLGCSLREVPGEPSCPMQW